MALSALSWQVGFTLSPAFGGFLLAALPNGVWWLAAGRISTHELRSSKSSIGGDPARRRVESDEG